MTLWQWQIFGSRETSAFSTSCLLVALNFWLLHGSIGACHKLVEVVVEVISTFWFFKVMVLFHMIQFEFR